MMTAFLGACAGNSAPESAAAATGGGLHADLTEFSVKFDQSSVAAGDVHVTVNNDGKLEHELVAFRTDLPVDQFPMKDGRADEEGAGVTHFDPEAENVKAGGTKTVTMHLPAGRYVFICNLPGHYAAGMRAEVTVK